MASLQFHLKEVQPGITCDKAELGKFKPLHIEQTNLKSRFTTFTQVYRPRDHKAAVKIMFGLLPKDNFV
jgi:hypothetical protein